MFSFNPPTANPTVIALWNALCDEEKRGIYDLWRRERVNPFEGDLYGENPYHSGAADPSVRLPEPSTDPIPFLSEQHIEFDDIEWLERFPNGIDSQESGEEADSAVYRIKLRGEERVLKVVSLLNCQDRLLINPSRVTVP